jgi:ASPM-SPD-2-Hydin domain-containing protein/HYDIN/CFA65/VesB family protein
MLFCVGATVVAAQQIQAEPRSQFRKEASRESVFAGAVPEVRQDVRHDVSPTVREMLALLDTNGISGVDTSSAETEREEMAKGTEKYATADPTRSVEEAREDKLIRHRSAVQSASTVQLETLAPVGTSSGLNFEGVSAALSGWAVPDTNGAVGTTQYVQWVNTFYAVYSKTTGGLVLGPLAGNTLWTGFGGPCETNNNGDVIAQFDKLASRWVMTQHATPAGGPYFQCVAVSTTSDATGSFYRYAFQLTSLFPDYPKLAVWPDAYYVTNNLQTATFGNGGSTVCALDRNSMLNGAAATSICFSTSPTYTSLLPADLDGTNPPPASAPNYLLNLGVNGLNLWKFHVDFVTPANSTFSGPAGIPVLPFSQACGGGVCVPQAGTSQTLDSVGDRLMYRLAYRHFQDGHESLVVAHSVGTPAGIRWYEIQNPGTTPVVNQQGTFSPDGNWRWMPSIAMDHMGDIAVGYSESSASMNPGIYYTGRVPSDPLGTMETETLIFQGAGSEVNANRWGDYSGMSVDPVDDCTFWYTNEYFPANGSRNWHTRVASFNFPSCSNAIPLVTLTPASLTFNSQMVNTTSPSQVVTLSNNQTTDLNISGISASGDFAQTNNCGSSIAAGATCAITVTFTPTATGARSGAITVTDSATNSPQTANLAGTGVTTAITFSPSSLSFGTQAVGTTSAANSITLTNSGAGALSINSVSATGGFSESDNCSGTIVQPSGQCNINVSFTPNLAGTYAGDITMSDSAPNSPQLIPITGIAVLPLTFSTLTLNFGNVTVGTNNGTKTVAITNNASTALTLAISASADYTAVGNGTAPCGTTLAAHAKCTIGVTFTPSMNGTIKGSVKVSYNGAFNPGLIGLTGVGVNGSTSPLSFSVATLSFANTIVGTTSVTKSVSASNVSASTVTISGITASGDFSAAPGGIKPCNGSVSAGASCTFTVVFSPLAPGTVSGSVAVTDDSSVSPQIVNLNGSAILPLSLSAASLSFPVQTVGTNSSPQTITVTNNQNTTATINFGTSGDYATSTTVTNPCGSTLAAKSQCNIGVVFAPTMTGTITGGLTLTYNAGFSPQIVNLSGTGQ